MSGKSSIPAERIEKAILLIRGEKVMLDADLAALYGVETGALTRAVRRNIDRFPGDFMFRLTIESCADKATACETWHGHLAHGASRATPAAWCHVRVAFRPLGQPEICSIVRAMSNNEEFGNLKRQFGISSQWGGRRYPPYAFTAQGVAMLSSVLRSKRAVLVNIEIMRAFVRLRRMLASHAELARKVAALEKKYDEQFKVVFDALRQLMKPPEPKSRRIGFRPEVEK